MERLAAAPTHLVPDSPSISGQLQDSRSRSCLEQELPDTSDSRNNEIKARNPREEYGIIILCFIFFLNYVLCTLFESLKICHETCNQLEPRKPSPPPHDGGCCRVLLPISTTSHRTTTTIGNRSYRCSVAVVAIGPPHAAVEWVIVCIPE
ncbi:unnamed protein product [Lactuca saligna]|uniref:Uncharacterized protein n=1 Tax=Lactuca saligna TaxID=75948 RepID=A0AA35Z9B9_LACSI|nr:unnamed protein product [Lactuca saligna]